MQPINYGAGYPPSYPQNYPIYPNCFDQLTTHGVLADDVVGYITDMPSPYLQNYVAQRGWQPSLPGQVLPDPLPNVQPKTPLPQGSIYHDVPQNLGPQTFEKKDNFKNAKNVATGLLLTGLIAFGIVKGKNFISKLFNKTTAAAGAATGTAAGTAGTAGGAAAGVKWYQTLGASIKKGFNTVCDFFKDTRNKILHRTPSTPPAPSPAGTP